MKTKKVDGYKKKGITRKMHAIKKDDKGIVGLKKIQHTINQSTPAKKRKEDKMMKPSVMERMTVGKTVSGVYTFCHGVAQPERSVAPKTAPGVFGRLQRHLYHGNIDPLDVTMGQNFSWNGLDDKLTGFVQYLNATNAPIDTYLKDQEAPRLVMLFSQPVADNREVKFDIRAIGSALHEILDSDIDGYDLVHRAATSECKTPFEYGIYAFRPPVSAAASNVVLFLVMVPVPISPESMDGKEDFSNVSVQSLGQMSSFAQRTTQRIRTSENVAASVMRSKIVKMMGNVPDAFLKEPLRLVSSSVDRWFKMVENKWFYASDYRKVNDDYNFMYSIPRGELMLKNGVQTLIAALPPQDASATTASSAMATMMMAANDSLFYPYSTGVHMLNLVEQDEIRVELPKHLVPMNLTSFHDKQSLVYDLTLDYPRITQERMCVEWNDKALILELKAGVYLPTQHRHPHLGGSVDPTARPVNYADMKAWAERSGGPKMLSIELASAKAFEHVLSTMNAMRPEHRNFENIHVTSTAMHFNLEHMHHELPQPAAAEAAAVTTTKITPTAGASSSSSSSGALAAE